MIECGTDAPTERALSQEDAVSYDFMSIFSFLFFFYFPLVFLELIFIAIALIFQTASASSSPNVTD